MKHLLKLTPLFLFLLTTNISYADDVKGFVGEWRGELVERRKARKIELVFWINDKGKLKGVTYYPEFKCAGRLRYDGFDRKGKRILSEVIFTLSPKCLSGGRIEFALTPDNKIKWYWDGGADSARGELQKHKVSADTMQFAKNEQAGIPTAADRGYKPPGQSTPVVKATVKHKTNITSPEGFYTVSEKSITRLKVDKYEAKNNRYIVDLITVDGIDPIFPVGQRASRAVWHLPSQQLLITDFARVPGLQQCNFWTKWYWTYKYEQLTPNVWQQVNKYDKANTPSTYCTNISIVPATCKWTCKQSPPSPKPNGYLVKGLAEAKALYKKIAKPRIVRRNTNNGRRSSGKKDHWQEYWDNKVKDARQNVIDNW